MKRPAWCEPIIDAFRGEQFKPTLILLCSPPLMVTWKYFGSPEAFLGVTAAHWPSLTSPAAAAFHSFAAAFVLLGLIPAILVRWVFGERLADYGVQWGEKRRTVVWLVAIAPVMALLAWLASRDPAIRAVYPIHRDMGMAWPAFFVHGVFYFLFYLGWEFHFRGFLQFGLRRQLGDVNALLVQVLASCLLHIGKPGGEVFLSIAGGVLWGITAYHTRSLLAGLVQHFILGILLDAFICFR